MARILVKTKWIIVGRCKNQCEKHLPMLLKIQNLFTLINRFSRIAEGTKFILSTFVGLTILNYKADPLSGRIWFSERAKKFKHSRKNT